MECGCRCGRLSAIQSDARLQRLFRQLHHRPHRRDEFQPGRPRVAVRSRLGVTDVQNNILTRSQSMFRKSLMAVAFAALWTTAASAAVSADEAKQLGTTLTAVGAKSVNGGLGVEGMLPGIPFPIPKSGYEAMWNHLMRYTASATRQKYDTWNVDSAGVPTLSTSGDLFSEYPLFDPKRPPDTV